MCISMTFYENPHTLQCLKKFQLNVTVLYMTISCTIDTVPTPAWKKVVAIPWLMGRQVER